MAATIIPFPTRPRLTPAVNEAMATALDTAWQSVRSAGPAVVDDPSLVRARMAAAILALAESGESHPERLLVGALDAVMLLIRQPPKQGRP